MKFLHTADIHLDSHKARIAHRNQAVDALLSDCTRQAFRNVIDQAITADVAFVLIAGDLYDGDWRDYGTGLFFAAEMRRLGRPCYIVQGNHDASSQITRTLQLPPNVHVFSADTASVVELTEWAVAIHGQSFGTRAVAENLAEGYPDPVQGRFNIGVLHSSVEGSNDHDPYAPCRLELLVNKGYDYWALGHVHTRATLHEFPHVHFPGNPQGRHPREPGSRGATLVEVQDGRVLSMTYCATDVVRWANVTVDANGAESMAELSARMGLAMAIIRDQAEGRPVIARVTVSGTTPLHAMLSLDTDQLTAEARNAAASLGWDFHIERIRVDTQPPIDGVAALGPLEASFRAGLDDPDLIDELLKDFTRLRGAIPGGVDVAVPTTGAELAAMGADAWQAVLHHLRGVA